MQPDGNDLLRANAVPQSSPDRIGRRGGVPKSTTAVGTETPGTELLAVNRTSDVWRIYHDHRFLGQIQPKSEQVSNVLRVGVVSAALDGSPETRLQARLAGTMWGLEILDAGHEDGGFELQVRARRPRLADTMPASAPIEDLNLLAHSENRLKSLGVTTLAGALQTGVDEILALPRYPFLVLFDLTEQLHDLRVT